MRKIILCMIIGILMMLFSACNLNYNNEKGQEYFNAIVLENHEDYLLVEPVEGEEELKSSNRIKVQKDIVSKNGVPDVEVGHEIRIVYDGNIMESYPAKLGIVYAVYLADEVD